MNRKGRIASDRKRKREKTLLFELAERLRRAKGAAEIAHLKGNLARLTFGE